MEGKPAEAENILLSVLPMARRYNLTSEFQKILTNLGLVYTYRGEYDKALDLHFKTLSLREKDGDKYELSISSLSKQRNI
jgi:hypothetical protein